MAKMSALSLYSIRGCQGWRKGGRILPTQSSGRLLVLCGEHDREITPSQSSHTTNMSAQAAMKAPFRLGMKEVYLYVESTGHPYCQDSCDH
jgi:hypothetical protein